MKSCITCGGPVGDRSPEHEAARQRLGMPSTPPQRCASCVWRSLLDISDEVIVVGDRGTSRVEGGEE